MINQARFRLLSGSTVYDCLSVGDFELVCSIVEQRLLDALCLTEVPEDILFEQLLADAIVVSVEVSQDRGLESESMRNYSYKMRDYGGSWDLLSKKSKDLLGKFNACPAGVTMQTDLAKRIYGHEHI
jgi:hypothetical protein